MEQLVVCAAIRNKRGIVICGARHFDLTMNVQIDKSYSAWLSKDIEEGFLDNKGNYLTREEAWIIAENAGQIRRRVGGDGKKLFSENLY